MAGKSAKIYTSGTEDRKYETLENRQWTTDQSAYTRTIINWKGYVLRAEVRRDHYDMQSNGRIELWTRAGWTDVSSIPYPQLDAVRRAIIYASPSIFVSQAVDVSTLIVAAQQILGASTL